MSEFGVISLAFRILGPPTGNVFPLQRPSDRLMGAGYPQQAQEGNNRDLADDRKTINYEGDTPAHQGCLD